MVTQCKRRDDQSAQVMVMPVSRRWENRDKNNRNSMKFPKRSGMFTANGVDVQHMIGVRRWKSGEK